MCFIYPCITPIDIEATSISMITPNDYYAQWCSLTQCGGEMVLFNALTLNKQIEGKATTHISMFI